MIQEDEMRDNIPYLQISLIQSILAQRVEKPWRIFQWFRRKKRKRKKEREEWMADIFKQPAMCIFMSGCSITAERNMAEKPIRDVKGYDVITCFHWWKNGRGACSIVVPLIKSRRGEALVSCRVRPSGWRCLCCLWNRHTQCLHVHPFQHEDWEKTTKHFM